MGFPKVGKDEKAAWSRNQNLVEALQEVKQFNLLWVQYGKPNLTFNQVKV